MAWFDLKRLVDKPAPLWSNGDSAYYGLNDRVKQDNAFKMTHSLVLIQPEALTVRVQIEGAQFGNPRKRVRALFGYHGLNYILMVTDPIAEQVFLAKPEDDYALTNTFLCISLGEAYEKDGYCYKLVAAVISRQPW